MWVFEVLPQVPGGEKSSALPYPEKFVLRETTRQKLGHDDVEDSRENSYVVGRQKNRCDIWVSIPSVSRTHALLQVSSHDFDPKDARTTLSLRIRDGVVGSKSSSSGTFVNSIKLMAGEWAQLADGDIVQFSAGAGSPKFKVRWERVCICTSKVVSSSSVEASARACGLYILRKMVRNCSLLVMSKATATIKAVTALAMCAPIVNTKWVEDASKTTISHAEHRFRNWLPLPDTSKEAYFPPKDEKPRHADYTVNARRKKMFASYSFLFYQPSQSYEFLVQCAGGTVFRMYDDPPPAAPSPSKFTLAVDLTVTESNFTASQISDLRRDGYMIVTPNHLGTSITQLSALSATVEASQLSSQSSGNNTIFMEDTGIGRNAALKDSNLAPLVRSSTSVVAAAEMRGGDGSVTVPPAYSVDCLKESPQRGPHGYPQANTSSSLQDPVPQPLAPDFPDMEASAAEDVMHDEPSPNMDIVSSEDSGPNLARKHPVSKESKSVGTKRRKVETSGPSSGSWIQPLKPKSCTDEEKRTKYCEEFEVLCVTPAAAQSGSGHPTLPPEGPAAESGRKRFRKQKLAQPPMGFERVGFDDDVSQRSHLIVASHSHLQNCENEQRNVLDTLMSNRSTKKKRRAR